MSDDWIRLIPSEPRFVPSEAQARRCLALVSQFADGAEEVNIIDEGQIVFVDAGQNFQSVGCPVCNHSLDTGWWAERVGAAHSRGYEDLGVDCPECGSTVSLNDLDYDWPQGFSRWRVEAMNPLIGRIDHDQVAAVADALGHAVRVIYTHV